METDLQALLDRIEAKLTASTSPWCRGDREAAEYAAYRSTKAFRKWANEAEAILSPADRYANLRHLSPDWKSWNDGTAYVAICYATARQRAEAFLRTIGKWKE